MTVDIYTAENCQPCKLTKTALARAEISFTEMDLDSDILSEARQQGIMAAPVVVVDGEIAWGGFRPDRIKALVA